MPQLYTSDVACPGKTYLELQFAAQKLSESGIFQLRKNSTMQCRLDKALMLLHLLTHMQPAT